MTRKTQTLQSLIVTALALLGAQSASAFSAGDACVSPYVIADGDVSSLRAAMLCANTDGSDSVVELATNGLYLFSEADPDDSSRALRSVGTDGLFTLRGNGATLQRDSAASAIFGILDLGQYSTAELYEVTLSGGSVDGGSPGGGLRVRGSAQATSIRVLDNISAGRGGGIAVSNNGTLVLSDSTVSGNSASGNGGGIRVDGGSALWLIRSTLQGNSVTGSGHGGGIQSQGLTRILNSTIIENVVVEAGGRGGGIELNTGGDLTMVNSTLVDNASPAAGEQLRQSGGLARVYNSILGERVADTVEDCALATPPNNTLVFDGSCDATLSGAISFLSPGVGGNGTLFLPLDSSATSAMGIADEDWLDERVLNVDLNGDGDDDDVFSTDIDQSGKPRTVDPGIDLGAAEYVCGIGSTYHPASPAELITALDCANADGSDSTLELVSESYTLSSTNNTDGGMGGNGLPRIVDDGDLSINGHQASIGRDPAAEDDFRLLFVDTEFDSVVLNDVAVEGGQLTGSSHRGGGILNRGNLQLHRSVVRGNSTRGFAARGGGIQNEGNLLLSRSLIDLNATFDDGAAGAGLNNESSGRAILVNSTVTRNIVASSTAGGIRSAGGETLLVLVNSTIAYNETDGYANEISVFDGTVESYNTLVATADGTACEGGGALSYLVENGMASDASCGATFTLDPQLAALDQSGFVAYYPLSGANVDSVDNGRSQWLAEPVLGHDLNGDGDSVDDLSGATDQGGEGRVLCTEVDLGAAEYQGCDRTYTVGGTLSGLADGNSVNLALNGIMAVEFSANGTFTFPGAIGYGGSYFVSVDAQPTTPNQTCTVSQGSGRIAASNVSNVLITCITNQYSIGGTVSGLASGTSVVLQNNGGDDLTITANGSFSFATPISDESSYAVTLTQQPSDPQQHCTVSNGDGLLSGTAVTDVTVTCVSLYTVGGTLSGLNAGSSVVLQNNDGDDLTLSANGAFVFPTALEDGASFAVTVLQQPTGPSQICTVTDGDGTLMGAAVSDITIDCATQQFSIGGSVVGLADGSSLVLRNNGGDDLSINANGAFVFNTPLNDGSSYSVTVAQQPNQPPQQCTVSDGNGVLSGAAVSGIIVSCSVNGVDLIASISDGVETLDGSPSLTYTIVIANQGPSDVEGAEVQSALSGALSNATWTCSAEPDAACPASGSGDIDTRIDLAAGTQVTFTLSAELPAGFVGVVETGVAVLPPSDRVEINAADNSATDRSASGRVFGSGFE
ncbi:right-handed parallel beta-helix repeat-containing protein [Pseudomarimonas arenosa]|uniref:Right handed beta helix domain-containing protein n=1 Tax=Pseudomarimonas arenosa TaxID=2774145 RepID=A0AAW3ZFK4_9GAMM|nr:hypothetical protein [Pseudomarimonas arenosa]MBD8524270.1 hypothetical protein [Pseudomarimonas arenosa]